MDSEERANCLTRLEGSIEKMNDNWADLANHANNDGASSLTLHLLDEFKELMADVYALARLAVEDSKNVKEKNTDGQ